MRLHGRSRPRRRCAGCWASAWTSRPYPPGRSNAPSSRRVELSIDARSFAVGDPRQDLADWEAFELAEFLQRAPEAKDEYLTGSKRAVKRVYTPADAGDWEDIG